METDTVSVFLAVAEETLYDCIQPEKKIAEIHLEQIQKQVFFPRTCYSVNKKHNKREPGLFKEEIMCTEMLYLCSKTYCCYDNKSDKTKFSSKGLNKRILEESGDGPTEKYRNVLDKAINLTSTNS